MIDLVRAEFLKLRSTRTALGLFIAAVVVSVLPALLVMALFPKDVLTGAGDGTVAAASGLALVPILAVVFGVLGMTNEYRHGTITYTYLATPRRWIVIIVKLLCFGVVGAAVMAVTGLLTLAAIGAVAGIRDIPLHWLSGVSITDYSRLGDIAMFLVTVGLMTAFGVGLGALFRAQVPTVAGVLIWALAIENIVILVKPKVGRFLPFNVFQQLDVGGTSGQSADTITRLTRPEAFVLSVCYITALAIAAVYISMRRDVT